MGSRVTPISAPASPTYWLVLFNQRTWRAFLTGGGRVVGFKLRRGASVQQIQPGDTLIFYLTGLSRWIGAAVATELAFTSEEPLWGLTALPWRLPVKCIVTLSPETAVPVTELRHSLSILPPAGEGRNWTARFRASPTRWPVCDGETVMETLLEASVMPVVREVDARKLNRQSSHLGPLGSLQQVSENGANYAVNIAGFREATSHTEIQWLLTRLGGAMGLNVWVARNDRGRSYQKQVLGELPGVLAELPCQFDSYTYNIVEMIDVLWLQGSAIVAAFEVESTTVIYSGLLRMADLVALQPNLNIPLYVVAPEVRRAKVMAEVNRPTFNRLNPPLRQLCHFIGFHGLRSRFRDVEGVMAYLRPDFLQELAEPCS